MLQIKVIDLNEVYELSCTNVLSDEQFLEKTENVWFWHHVEFTLKQYDKN
jgi:hypothetical protein